MSIIVKLICQGDVDVDHNVRECKSEPAQDKLYQNGRYLACLQSSNTLRGSLDSYLRGQKDLSCSVLITLVRKLYEKMRRRSTIMDCLSQSDKLDTRTRSVSLIR